jgi:hypothetical protein
MGSRKCRVWAPLGGFTLGKCAASKSLTPNSELRLLVAVRRTALAEGGVALSLRLVDGLLDERAERTRAGRHRDPSPS